MKINSIIKAFKRVGKITKRQQFVIVVFILAIGLVATQLVPIERRNEMVIGLASLTAVLTLLVLKENLKGIEFLSLVILPVMFTVSIAFSYFLLPVRWLTRVPTVVVYSFIMYAAFLTENIYNVAAHRSIQLLRAAQTVGLLISLITAFLLFNTVFSFHLPSYSNAILIFIITLPLAFQALWSVVLEERLTSNVGIPSLVVALLFSEIAFILSIWPINTTITALFLTTLLYSLIGILQNRLLDKLFPNTLREYLIVMLITFILALVTTSWG